MLKLIRITLSIGLAGFFMLSPENRSLKKLQQSPNSHPKFTTAL